jgi:hypothetical protein
VEGTAWCWRSANAPAGGADAVEVEHNPFPETRYRIVCYELEHGQQTKIFDHTARGFIAVTGTNERTT